MFGPVGWIVDKRSGEYYEAPWMHALTWLELVNKGVAQTSVSPEEISRLIKDFRREPAEDGSLVRTEERYDSRDDNSFTDAIKDAEEEMHKDFIRVVAGDMIEVETTGVEDLPRVKAFIRNMPELWEKDVRVEDREGSNVLYSGSAEQLIKKQVAAKTSRGSYVKL